ncbi:MAG: SMP-30/gluconolactonase/LRE family protein [Polyangiales bacterium]
MRYFALCVIAVGALGCGDDDGSGGNAGSGGAAGTAGSGGATLLLDEYILEDDALVPESGAFDSESRSFFVGSASEGSITRVEADGTELVVYEPPAEETWRTLGIAIDADARRLWACAQEGETGATTTQELWIFDLPDGERTATLDLATAAEGSTCNDIALDSSGLAYVSDSANPRVYRADAAAQSVEVWADDPLLAAEGANFGGNGIAVTEDDAFVLLSKTLATVSTPRLLRIARGDPTNIVGINTTPELSGAADGMSFLGGDLYLAIVGTGEVVRLVSGDDWANATVTVTAAVAGTSTVRPAEGQLYGIYSDITALLLGNPVSPPFRIFRIDLSSFE